MKNESEVLKCPICFGLIDISKFLREYFFENRSYKLYHCLNCDIQFWWPLEMKSDLYEKEFLEMYSIMHKGRKKLSPHHRPFFKFFPIKKGKLLDIGCGDGVFLQYAREIGFDVYGIDLDKKSIEACKRNFGLENVYYSTLRDFGVFCKEEKLQFDVITFFEVLEHQNDPLEFIQLVKQILKPDGLIAGSVPNRDRLFVEICRVDKVDFPPHHFLWFSEKSIRKFLIRHGFQIKGLYPVKFNFIEFALRVHSRFFSFYLPAFSRADKRESRSLVYTKYLLAGPIFMISALILPLFNKKGNQIYFQGRMI